MSSQKDSVDIYQSFFENLAYFCSNENDLSKFAISLIESIPEVQEIFLRMFGILEDDLSTRIKEVKFDKPLIKKSNLRPDFQIKLSNGKFFLLEAKLFSHSNCHFYEYSNQKPDANYYGLILFEDNDQKIELSYKFKKKDEYCSPDEKGYISIKNERNNEIKWKIATWNNFIDKLKNLEIYDNQKKSLIEYFINYASALEKLKFETFWEKFTPIMNNRMKKQNLKDSKGNYLSCSEKTTKGHSKYFTFAPKHDVTISFGVHIFIRPRIFKISIKIDFYSREATKFVLEYYKKFINSGITSRKYQDLIANEEEKITKKTIELTSKKFSYGFEEILKDDDKMNKIIKWTMEEIGKYHKEIFKR